MATRSVRLWLARDEKSRPGDNGPPRYFLFIRKPTLRKGHWDSDRQLVVNVMSTYISEELIGYLKPGEGPVKLRVTVERDEG